MMACTVSVAEKMYCNAATSEGPGVKHCADQVGEYVND